jgi:hypothetical protein
MLETMPAQSPSTTDQPSHLATAASIFRLYLSLAATSPSDPEAGLGGKLLYAGEIDAEGRTLLRAANIAGAASLAASADVSVQRQAIRDGVVDFLVTSLDEALRILKNEVRKRLPVAVGVRLEPAEMVRQMLERGVLPDLLADSAAGDAKRAFAGQGALCIAAPPQPVLPYVAWSVDRDSSVWLPKLDRCAAEVVPAEDHVRQRWLRLAPRYLGRSARSEHGVGLGPAEVERLSEAFGTLQGIEDGWPHINLAGETPG